MSARLATLGAKGGFGANAYGNHVGLKTLAAVAAANHSNPMAVMRQYSPLPRDAQEIIDNEILEVGKQGLVIASDLLASLSRPVPNPLSFTTLTSQRLGEAGRAQIGMVPNTRGERQVQDLEEYSTPVFYVWDDWEFPANFLATAARVGFAVNENMAAQATRNVNERIEDYTINGLKDADGTNILVYGLPVYGLLNAPNANAYQYVGGVAWDNAGHTGAEIVTDITAMIALAEAANYRGPYTLYIPTAYAFKFMLDYATGYPATILSRLQQIPGLSSIITASTLPANRTILVQKTRNVMDMLVGMTPTNFSWATNPQMPYSGVSSMVAACIIPRPKYDYNDQSGIVLGGVDAV